MDKVMKDQDHKIKTCIIGNMAVGKTSLILRIHQNKFKQKTVPTSGVDYNSKKQTINGEGVVVELWDTTGQDRFRSVVSNFFRGADGIFLVFDMTSQKSLMDLDIWLKQLKSVLDDSVPKILLGNKLDLKPHLSPEEEQKVEGYCNQNNMKFIKVSARSGQGIHSAYDTLVQDAYVYSYNKRKGSTVPIIIDKNKKKKGKKCC